MNKIKIIFIILAFSQMASAAKVLGNIKTGQYSIREGILQAILAKEMCSCVYVSQLQVPDSVPEDEVLDYRVRSCLRRSNLPIGAGVLNILTKHRFEWNDGKSIVEFRSSFVGRLLSFHISSDKQKSVAVYYGPKVGCKSLP